MGLPPVSGFSSTPPENPLPLTDGDSARGEERTVTVAGQQSIVAVMGSPGGDGLRSIFPSQGNAGTEQPGTTIYCRIRSHPLYGLAAGFQGEMYRTYHLEYWPSFLQHSHSHTHYNHHHIYYITEYSTLAVVEQVSTEETTTEQNSHSHHHHHHHHHHTHTSSVEYTAHIYQHASSTAELAKLDAELTALEEKLDSLEQGLFEVEEAAYEGAQSFHWAIDDLEAELEGTLEWDMSDFEQVLGVMEEQPADEVDAQQIVETPSESCDCHCQGACNCAEIQPASPNSGAAPAPAPAAIDQASPPFAQLRKHLPKFLCLRNIMGNITVAFHTGRAGTAHPPTSVELNLRHNRDFRLMLLPPDVHAVTIRRPHGRPISFMTEGNHLFEVSVRVTLGHFVHNVSVLRQLYRGLANEYLRAIGAPPTSLLARELHGAINSLTVENAQTHLRRIYSLLDMNTDAHLWPLHNAEVTPADNISSARELSEPSKGEPED